MSFGSPPKADEIELALFGPGYGEAIAIHLPGGVWILVDSCIEPSSKQPAALHYLSKLNVSLNSVAAIVATHWHDDHVRGLGKLVQTCPKADLFLSSALNSTEAATFLSAYNGKISSNLSRGAREVGEAIAARAEYYWTQQRTIVLEKTALGVPISVVALAPVPAAFSRCLVAFAKNIPGVDSAMTHAPDLRPNIESIVLHIEVGAESILLGADLEENSKFGWSAIARNSWCQSRKPASAYKVAHHGGASAECSETWTNLLADQPVAALTPFAHGRVRLPSDDDRDRIRSRATRSFCASNASRKPRMDSRIAKRLSQISRGLQVLESGFGIVRLRKRANSEWSIETFGAAGPL